MPRGDAAPVAPLRMTRRFAIGGLVVMVVAAIVLSRSNYALTTSQLHTVAAQTNTNLTSAIANTVWPLFGSFLTSAHELTADEIREHPRTIALLAKVTGLMAGTKILRFSIHDLDGLTVFSTSPNLVGHDADHDAAYQTARAGGSESLLDLRPKADGADIGGLWVVSSFVPILGTDGQIEAVAAIHSDVTSTHEIAARTNITLLIVVSMTFSLVFALLLALVWRADQILRSQHLGQVEQAASAARAESRRLLETLMEAWPDMVYVKDTQSRFVIANATTANLMSGTTSAELVGRTDFDFHAPDLAQAFYESEREIIETGRSVINREERIKTPEGAEIWLSTTKIPFTDENGEIAGFVGIGHDITSNKRTADALRVAKEEAESANRTKSQFLANMSHELRTPLNAIIGFSDIIRRETFGAVGQPQYREYANDINQSGQHLLELISEILDLSKIESGSEEIQEEEVDVTAAIENVVKLLRERAQQGGIALHVDLPVITCQLRADPRRFKQILINLLSNGIKFTEPGGSVSLRVRHTQGSGYMFEFVDTGIGIAPEDIPLALAPFGQVDSTMSRRFEGTGLGLPLAKSFVEMHEGTLELTSILGSGTTVTVRFPPARIIPEVRAAHAS